MRLPRFRYSLKALLTLMSVVAVVAAVWSSLRRSAENQRRAIDAIAAKGGFVWLDRADDHIEIEFGSPKHEICGQIIMVGTPLAGSFIKPGPPVFADADLPLIDRIRHVKKIDFEFTDVTPAAMDRFRSRHRGCMVIP